MQSNSSEKFHVQRDVKKCSSCYSIGEADSIPDIFLPDDSEFTYQNSLNNEETILFYSKSAHKYFHQIILNSFPLDDISGMISSIRIYISESVTQTPVLIEGESVYIDPDFSTEIILTHLELVLIPLINKLSKSGLIHTNLIDSVLFNRGNQLSSHQALVINHVELSDEFMNGIQILDTEKISISKGLMAYDFGLIDFLKIGHDRQTVEVIERCTSCGNEKHFKYSHPHRNQSPVKPNKIISVVEAEDKLPFFSKVKIEQFIVLQFLFSKTETTALNHFAHFLIEYNSKYHGMEFYIVNSELLSADEEPNLFLNQDELLGQIINEVLRGTLTWKKDKFLDLHSVNKLSLSKSKVNDPVNIWGEAHYKSVMLKWIGELEQFDFPRNELSYKVLFR